MSTLVAAVCISVVGAFLLLGAFSYYLHYRHTRRLRQPITIRQLRIELAPEVEALEILRAATIYQPRAFSDGPGFSIFDLAFTDASLSRLEVGIPVGLQAHPQTFKVIEEEAWIPTAAPKGGRSLGTEQILLQASTTIQGSRQVRIDLN